MKPRQLAAISGIALTCYMLGVWTAPAFHGEVPETRTPAKPPRSNQGQPSLDGGLNPSQPGRQRTTVSAHSDEDRISVSRKSIRNLLNGKTYGSARCFDSLTFIVADALTVLGVTELQTISANWIFEASAQELKKQEKKLAKISQPTPSTIVIELTAVHAQARKSIQDMQTNLRAELPAGTAEVLISSIPWESYYLPEGVRTVTLTARQNSGGYVSGNIRSNPDLFAKTYTSDLQHPTNSPLEASQIFKDWDHLLEGITIVPQPTE